jgi:hypothetical protein
MAHNGAANRLVLPAVIVLVWTLGGVFMASWRRYARALIPAATVVLGCGWGAMAEPPGASSDQRLLDPTTFDQTPEMTQPRVPVPAKGPATGKAHARKDDAAEQDPATAAARYFDRRLPTHGADRHMISAVPKGSGFGDADGRAPRTNVGTFSLGVETDTNYKPRTPFNPDGSETGYDANYVPHRVTVPFIGLSATSILPP